MINLRGFVARDRANRVAISGKHAYLAANWSAPEQSQLTLVDVHDTAHPKLLATISAPSAGEGILVSDPISPTLRASLTLGTAATWVAVEGSLAYVVYRDGTSNRLAAIDISDPDHPALISSIALPTSYGYISDLQASGAFAYLSYTAGYTGGVAIVDTSDPAALALRRFYATSTVERLRVAGDRLYLVSAWSGLELAQIQELNQLARLPLALSQAAP